MTNRDRRIKKFTSHRSTTSKYTAVGVYVISSEKLVHASRIQMQICLFSVQDNRGFYFANYSLISDNAAQQNYIHQKKITNLFEFRGYSVYIPSITRILL